VSSLWTPEGEHRVSRDEPGDDASGTGAHPGPSEGPPGGIAAPESEEEARLRAEMAEMERELADAPVEDVIANHCYGMFQLAALHLGQQPPRLEEARLAIDAYAAVVEGLGDRLGPAAPTLRDGLAQIRLAFVQIAAVEQAASGGEGAPSAPETAPDSEAPEARPGE
jgi:hypothetical protein